MQGPRVPRFAAIHLRTLVLLFTVTFLVLAWWWATPHLVFPVKGATLYVSGKVVVLDAGHGGADPGAVGRSGVLEKDVVLDVARSLERLLNRVAVYTMMVRDGDYDLAPDGARSRKQEDLSRRVGMANDAKADLYISLHANSFPSPRWSGAQTFYYPGKDEGKRLAQSIQARLREAFPQNTRLARPGDYYVLKQTDMPAVVVEVGFLSNPEEEQLLSTIRHRHALAQAVFMGIVDYLVAIERDP